MFSLENAALSRDGFMRLLRKIYTKSCSGSTQMQVPVNPKCPYAFEDACAGSGDFDGLVVSGASNPSLRREVLLPVVVNVFTVEGEKNL
jgi:hypothetical protein